MQLDHCGNNAVLVSQIFSLTQLSEHRWSKTAIFVWTKSRASDMKTVWLFQMSWEQNKRSSNVVCFLWHDLLFVYSCSRTNWCWYCNNLLTPGLYNVCAILLMNTPAQTICYNNMLSATYTERRFVAPGRCISLRTTATSSRHCRILWVLILHRRLVQERMLQSIDLWRK